MSLVFQTPLQPTLHHHNHKPLLTPSLPLHRKPTLLTCHVSLTSSTSKQSLSPEPKPVFSSVSTFAPATVANLGPCFDFLGCAISNLGDHVSLSVDPTTPPGQLSISSISGDLAGKLSLDPLNNCAGLPLGSGLGSSAASAAAGAAAVNALFGSRLSQLELVLAGLESEAKVSGYHADNIAPAVMGGFVLVQNYNPLTLVNVDFPKEKELIFVLVSPEFEAPTKKMRAALPKEITMADHVWNSSQAAALVAAVVRGDVEGVGRAMSEDRVVETRRMGLIPGFEAVKMAAIEAGAFGCTISGAGPTAVAVVDREERGRGVGEKMVEAFSRVGGLKASFVVERLDRVGARVVDSVPL